MTDVRKWVDEYSDEFVMGDESNGLLVMDGFDDCIEGVVERFNDTFVLYDYEKVIQRLVSRDGMSREDAEEWYSFNMVGGWHGPHTVGFVRKMVLPVAE